MPRLPRALAALLLVAGCARSSDNVTSDAAPAPMEESRAGAAAGAPVAPAAQALPRALPDSTLGRRLVRTADVGLVVADVPAARREVVALTRRAGGFVGTEGESRQGERTEVRLTLRIPAARFDEVLDALTAAGDDVAYRNVRVDDVTEQYVDLEARLRARRAVLDRYLVLLARADDVGEILAVEARVAETQEAIESAQGQLRSLRDRVGLSTIEVSLTDGEPWAIGGGPPFVRRLREAFATGLAGVADLALALVALWPVWLVGGLMFAMLRPWLRRRRLPANTGAAPAGPGTGAPPAPAA